MKNIKWGIWEDIKIVSVFFFGKSLKLIDILPKTCRAANKFKENKISNDIWYDLEYKRSISVKTIVIKPLSND